MWTIVLQATAIYTLSMILGHHLSENIFDQVLQDEAFKNMTNALDKPGSFGLDAGEDTNKTFSVLGGATAGLINGTATNGTSNVIKDSPESFYGKRLPREVVVLLVLCTLGYCWLIWLERMLPARPRRKDVPYEGKERVEESEDREEEVVKRWIAQGRVRRASLNWCNTFLKWVLDLTVGHLWYHTVEHLVRGLLKLQSPKEILGGLAEHLLFNFVGSYFLSIKPLASLVAFIAIPAHKQTVFLASADLVATIFVTTVIRVFANWVVKTDFAQTMMRDTTERAKEMQQMKRDHKTMTGLSALPKWDFDREL
ncbi:hypothetical protein K458DRAFT_413158 [Lentithecium fluviatile CBS 122367]|uniref:Uncharacterized protein n=1 Tax=Lentithecium fluviatile CBS 122367 TaxID=1168545 RepID=A0A6G1JIT7_9PLEO|nr:hypothetical protein K458DRAFT_413158 [Lentithecium fluviatile CBS 122367]